MYKILGSNKTALFRKTASTILSVAQLGSSIGKIIGNLGIINNTHCPYIYKLLWTCFWQKKKIHLTGFFVTKIKRFQCNFEYRSVKLFLSYSVRCDSVWVKIVTVSVIYTVVEMPISRVYHLNKYCSCYRCFPIKIRMLNALLHLGQ